MAEGARAGTLAERTQSCLALVTQCVDVRLAGTYIRSVAHSTSLTDDRLAALYVGEGFGGDNTMRAKVIRELVDEIRSLRAELADSDGAEST